uniref:Reverse transcriptase domain-containing protein n=1 Tax=Tanacetum cinerariifolium TaxID=118510 RepID=A0A6L2NPZ5_TANCI|nr:reverse transcriptase domain-containing protein [Tanacetum cinerariifolium]
MTNADNANRNPEPKEAPIARNCSYKEFISCQPFNFKDCKVKFATGTLTEEALSWWNSFAQPIGIEEAYTITWVEFKKLLIKKYCSHTEIQKMEDEFYHMTVKGNDLKTYVKRFQELETLCTTMVSDSKKLLEAFIRGLPQIVEKKKSDEKRLEDILVVREFPDVFLEDLPGLPPIHQVEFQIDLYPGATLIAKPLTKLTQKHKKYIWEEDQESAFHLLKQKLYEASILSLPEGNDDLVVYCDVSLQDSGNSLENALGTQLDMSTAYQPENDGQRYEIQSSYASITSNDQGFIVDRNMDDFLVIENFGMILGQPVHTDDNVKTIEFSRHEINFKRGFWIAGSIWQTSNANSGTIGERTIEQYMDHIQDDAGPGVVRPPSRDAARFELKGQFVKELRENNFSRIRTEDANKHIDKVLEIFDLFHEPDVNEDQLMLRQFMQRPPVFESDHFIYWKNIFETYVKVKDLDLWNIILNGDFPTLAENKVIQISEVVPIEEQSDDLKKKLAKNNEAKMVLYNALPKKEYERIFMCKTDKDIWQSLLITHQGKKERVKSIALKAKKESSDDETSTSGSDGEEYAMAVRNFKKFFRRKGKFVRQPREEKKSFRQRDEKKGKSDQKCLGAVIQIISLKIVQNHLATKIKRPSLEVLKAIAKMTPKTKLTMKLVSWLNR